MRALEQFFVHGRLRPNPRFATSPPQMTDTRWRQLQQDLHHHLNAILPVEQGGVAIQRLVHAYAGQQRLPHYDYDSAVHRTWDRDGDRLSLGPVPIGFAFDGECADDTAANEAPEMTPRAVPRPPPKTKWRRTYSSSGSHIRPKRTKAKRRRSEAQQHERKSDERGHEPARTTGKCFRYGRRRGHRPHIANTYYEDVIAVGKDRHRWHGVDLTADGFRTRSGKRRVKRIIDEVGTSEHLQEIVVNYKDCAHALRQIARTKSVQRVVITGCHRLQRGRVANVFAGHYGYQIHRSAPAEDTDPRIKQLILPDPGADYGRQYTPSCFMMGSHQEPREADDGVPGDRGLAVDRGWANVGRIPGFGYGVFANRDLAPNSVLGQYTGVVLSRTDKELLSGGNLPCFVAQVDNDTFLDAQDPRTSSFARYINHPGPHQHENVHFIAHDGAVYVVTTSDVSTGQQLFTDYGPTFDWSEPPRDVPGAESYSYIPGDEREQQGEALALHANGDPSRVILDSGASDHNTYVGNLKPGSCRPADRTLRSFAGKSMSPAKIGILQLHGRAGKVELGGTNGFARQPPATLVSPGALDRKHGIVTIIQDGRAYCLAPGTRFEIDDSKVVLSFTNHPGDCLYHLDPPPGQRGLLPTSRRHRRLAARTPPPPGRPCPLRLPGATGPRPEHQWPSPALLGLRPRETSQDADSTSSSN